MARWMMLGLLALAACSPGCGSSRASMTNLTERWRPNIEFEVYPRASRELNCPREALEFSCLDGRCRSVKIWGCGQTANYTYNASRTWVRE